MDCRERGQSVTFLSKGVNVSWGETRPQGLRGPWKAAFYAQISAALLVESSSPFFLKPEDLDWFRRVIGRQLERVLHKQLKQFHSNTRKELTVGCTKPLCPLWFFSRASLPSVQKA